MFPRNSGSVDSNLGHSSASQMEASNLPVAQSAGEQSTSGEQSTAPCTAGTANNVSNINSAQSVGGAMGTVGPSTTSEGQDKRKLIQLQLVLLLHAYKCRINETQTNGEVRQCSLPNCSTMKQVLAHMTTCQAGKSCTVPHCSSSSQIISHWKNCTQSDCPVCVPLKQAAGRKQQQAAAVQAVQTNQSYSPLDMQQVYTVLGLPYKSGEDGSDVNAMLQRGQAVTGPNVTDDGPRRYSPNVGHIQALQPIQQQIIQLSQLHLSPKLQDNEANVIPSSSAQNVLMNDNFQSKMNSTNSASGSKEWRQSVDQDLRQHLVQKIVQAIFPTIDVNTDRDSRMIKSVAYAEKVENEMYKSANTREEYYQLLAEKIYKIQKELEEELQNA